jgi:hypothetical protein
MLVRNMLVRIALVRIALIRKPWFANATRRYQRRVGVSHDRGCAGKLTA